jgi:hypothetical protein
MTKRTLALTGLIVLAALSRLLPHPWNFAPITAIAVFGGVRCGSRRAALAFPLLALLLTDLAQEALYRNGLAPYRGLYRGMWVTYGTTALIALMARLARGSRNPAVITGTTLAGSCVFFVVTNFAVWVGSSTYPQTAEGLATCYVAALPFFGNALLGDLFYGAILFGVWALAERFVPALRASAPPGSDHPVKLTA